MSRDIRRVPLDWQHPTEPNPHWLSHARFALDRGTMSRLHMPQVRFVGLVDDYPEAVARWEEELSEARDRRGRTWTFNVEYHLTGFQGHSDIEPTVHPFYGWSEDGMAETETVVRDEDHLHELLVARIESEHPDAAHYMPVFDGDDLGWCLYETVSEGTPITPVFETAAELVEHLCTEGDDWNQEPWRRAAADRIVEVGGSFGSFVVTGDRRVLDGARDIDMLGGESR